MSKSNETRAPYLSLLIISKWFCMIKKIDHRVKLSFYHTDLLQIFCVRSYWSSKCLVEINNSILEKCAWERIFALEIHSFHTDQG